MLEDALTGLVRVDTFCIKGLFAVGSSVCFDHMSGCTLGPDGCAMLCRVMPQWHRLVELDLHGAFDCSRIVHPTHLPADIAVSAEEWLQLESALSQMGTLRTLKVNGTFVYLACFHCLTVGGATLGEAGRAVVSRLVALPRAQPLMVTMDGMMH